jgi:hypothetical protein
MWRTDTTNPVHLSEISLVSFAKFTDTFFFFNALFRCGMEKVNNCLLFCAQGWKKEQCTYVTLRRASHIVFERSELKYQANTRLPWWLCSFSPFRLMLRQCNVCIWKALQNDGESVRSGNWMITDPYWPWGQLHPFWHGSVRVTTGGQARGPNPTEHAQWAGPQPAGQYGHCASSRHGHDQPTQEEGEMVFVAVVFNLFWQARLIFGLSCSKAVWAGWPVCLSGISCDNSFCMSDVCSHSVLIISF